MLRGSARALVLVVLLALVTVAPASAAITPTLNVTPDPALPLQPQELTIDADFAYSDPASTTEDLAETAKLSLPEGLLANPEAAPKCASEAAMVNGDCASSQVGTATVTILGFGDLAATIHNLDHPDTVLARIGIRIPAGPLGTLSSIADATLRTAGTDNGIDLTMMGIDPVPGAGKITGLLMRLEDIVGAAPFTRFPTYCDEGATVSLTVSSTADPTPKTASDTITILPVCGPALPFDPGFSATAVRATDASLALSTQITQQPTQAAIETTTIVLPPAVFPRSSKVLTDPCTTPDPGDCPASSRVGTLEATLPVLADPVGGFVTIGPGGTGGLPNLWLVLDDPLGLNVRGRVQLLNGQVITTFDDIPDAPITNLEVSFTGGPDSLLMAFSSVTNECVGARLIGHNGDVVTRTAKLGPNAVCARSTAGGGGSQSLLEGACSNVKLGTAGPDLLVGTAVGDRLNGGAGDDTLRGLDGADCLFGEAGRDRLSGGAGGDQLSGGTGNDRLAGDSGRDRLGGDSGRDRLSGGADNDRLSGGSGNDRLNGGSGGDRLSGGSGRDRLRGSSGNDRLSGGSRGDRLIGGRGRDRFRGGSGNDRINSRDRRRETVNCGSGRRDRATVDRSDRVRGCERVRRR